MSFIIAKIIDGKFDIRSDSRITDPKIIQTNPLSGILKTIIIDPKTCISFAGIVDEANMAIEYLLQNQFTSINEIVSYLLSVNINSNDKTDFIVKSLHKEDPCMFKISGGNIEENMQSAWIGDYLAFSLFQSQMNSQNENLDLRQKIENSFKHVLQDESIESVGDYHIHVVSRNDVFEYNIRIDLDLGPQTIKIEKANEWTTIPLGTAMNGSFGMSYLVSNIESKYAIGVYYTHGNFGVLLYPKFSMKPIIIKGGNCKMFVEFIQKEFEIKLEGMIMN